MLLTSDRASFIAGSVCGWTASDKQCAVMRRVHERRAGDSGEGGDAGVHAQCAPPGPRLLHVRLQRPQPGEREQMIPVRTREEVLCSKAASACSCSACGQGRGTLTQAVLVPGELQRVVRRTPITPQWAFT